MVLAGAAAVAVAASLALVWWRQQFPDRPRAGRVLALPIGIALVAAWVSAVQLILGERAALLTSTDPDQKLALADVLVVLVAFCLFLALAVAAIVAALK